MIIGKKLVRRVEIDLSRGIMSMRNAMGRENGDFLLHTWVFSCWNKQVGLQTQQTQRLCYKKKQQPKLYDKS